MMVVDITNYIESNTDWVEGTTLFANFRPNDPDTVAVISDYESGEAPPDTMTQAIPHAEWRRFQCAVRGTTIPATEAACRALYELLCGVLSVDINSTTYTLTPVSVPTMVQRDERNRIVYATSFRVMVG
jgi:hypothetical protein